MLDVEIIEDPQAAAAALEPMRSRLLAELSEPASAAMLAPRVGSSRQKVNYHLRALERHRLVRLAEERRRRGLIERLLVATAATYLVSPGAVGPVAVDPDRNPDRLSAGYLIAVAGRAIREVHHLMQKARTLGKRLPTLSLDSEIRFRSAADRAAFTAELTQAIAALIGRYHDATAPQGRPHRLVVLAHPLPEKNEKESS